MTSILPIQVIVETFHRENSEKIFEPIQMAQALQYAQQMSEIHNVDFTLVKQGDKNVMAFMDGNITNSNVEVSDGSW